MHQVQERAEQWILENASNSELCWNFQPESISNGVKLKYIRHLFKKIKMIIHFWATFIKRNNTYFRQLTNIFVHTAQNLCYSSVLIGPDIGEVMDLYSIMYLKHKILVLKNTIYGHRGVLSRREVLALSLWIWKEKFFEKHVAN